MAPSGTAAGPGRGAASGAAWGLRSTGAWLDACSVGADMVMNNTLTIGALVASMALGWRVLGPFQSVIMLLNRATQIRSSLRQINHLMRLAPERVAGRVPPKRTSIPAKKRCSPKVSRDVEMGSRLSLVR